MKLITKDTGYALEALVFLADQKRETVSVSEIAAHLELSHAFLRKVLQVLCKKGILKSYKGKTGGFTLAKHPKDITVDHIMHIYQKSLEFSECVTGKKICKAPGGCQFKTKMSIVEKNLKQQLRQITIASMLRSVK